MEILQIRCSLSCAAEGNEQTVFRIAQLGESAIPFPPTRTELHDVQQTWQRA